MGGGGDTIWQMPKPGLLSAQLMNGHSDMWTKLRLGALYPGVKGHAKAPPTEWETRAGQSYPSTHAGRTQRYAESCPCLFIFTTRGSTRDGFVVCGPHESDRRRRRSQHQPDNESALINAPKYSPKSPTDSPCYGSRRREGGKKPSLS